MKTIGEGTFGKVKLGTHILTGERVAVKVLEKERIMEIADVERVAREIHILKLIRKSRHIIQLYEIIETPRQLYLIMEYAPGGELFDYIVEHGRAEEQEACRFLHQILAGVERVHENNVVHRDLKPENLLLTEKKDIKIVDFGLSNTHKDDQLLLTACGSPCYAAPEMIANQKYVPSMVDIWSCGVILFALVCGYLPFEDQNHVELYRKICNAEYEMPTFVSPEVSDLIRGMLTTDPAQRLNLKRIRQHPWYTQIPEASLKEFEDNGQLEEPILVTLDSFGFPREYSVKCLLGNKHNHLTTTYYLLKERRLREGVGVSQGCSHAVAELEATCAEDGAHSFPNSMPAAAATAMAVATVATPSRGSRLEATGSRNSRPRRPRSAPRRQPGGVVRQCAWVEQPAAGGRHCDPRSASPGIRGPRSQGGLLRHDHEEIDWGRPVISHPAVHYPAERGHGAEAWHPVAYAMDDGYSPCSSYGGRGPPDPFNGFGFGLGSRDVMGRATYESGNATPSMPDDSAENCTLQVPCGPDMHPQRIMHELCRTLAEHGLSYRQISSFAVCFQEQGVRFQDAHLRVRAEVVQLDRGGGYVLRLCCMAGEYGPFADLCTRLFQHAEL